MIKENENLAVLSAAFNPPNLNHYSLILQLLNKYDTVIIFPFINSPNKYYRQSLGYKRRFTLLKNFIQDFFPQLSDKIILVDIKKELGLKTTKISLSETTKYVNKILNTEGVENYYCFEDLQEENDLIKKHHLAQVKNIDIKKITEEENYSKKVRTLLKNKSSFTRNRKDILTLKGQIGSRNYNYFTENNPYEIKKIHLEYKNKKNIK